MLGRESEFVSACLSARLDHKSGALAAWNARYQGPPHNGTPPHNAKDGAELAAFIDGGADAYIDRRQLAPTEYFQELAKYRFLIAPNGNGVTSPKFIEAVMLMTIP